MLIHKTLAGINLAGLALGLTACLLILLYVQHELSYDAMHSHADRIYRITSVLHTPEAEMAIASSPIPLATALKQYMEEVQASARFQPVAAAVRYEDKLFQETHVYFSEQAALRIFSFSLQQGDTSQALARPFSAIISARMAHKYFGEEHPLGKSIAVNQQQYLVTAVMENLPDNTDMPIDMLLSYDFSGHTQWMEDDFPVYTFVLLDEPLSPALLNEKLQQLAAPYAQAELDAYGADGYRIRFIAENLRDVHFSEAKLADMPKGNRKLVYIFLALALFILLTAYLNYINLSIVKAGSRCKEVSLRKISGATRMQLGRQFLLEAALMHLLAFAIALTLLQLLLPYFRHLLGIQLALSGRHLLMAMLFFLLPGTILSGFYPAFVLSAVSPLSLLQDRVLALGKVKVRQGITVFQFMLTTILILGSLVIARQVQYIRLQHPGFDRAHVLNIFLPDDTVQQKAATAFLHALRQESVVEAASMGNGLNPEALLPQGSTVITADRAKREVMSNYLFIDETFVPLLNIKLQAGRNLKAEHSADRQEAFLVNEAFVKLAGWQQPIGQSMEGFGHKGTVVGVVNDFHYRSLHNPVEPLVLVYNTLLPTSIMLKIKPKHLDLVSQLWHKHYPDFPMEYRFLDEAFEAQYRKDITFMQLFHLFTLLAVVISCAGLYGLFALLSVKRTKEMGIRKVLGASVQQLVWLLSAECGRLILAALLLALPLACWLLQHWLSYYAFSISISGWQLLACVAAVILIAGISVGAHTVKTAYTNPVDSLRHE